jgi:hypothetical protein
MRRVYYISTCKLLPHVVALMRWISTQNSKIAAETPSQGPQNVLDSDLRAGNAYGRNGARPNLSLSPKLEPESESALSFIKHDSQFEEDIFPCEVYSLYPETDWRDLESELEESGMTAYAADFCESFFCEQVRTCMYACMYMLHACVNAHTYMHEHSIHICIYMQILTYMHMHVNIDIYIYLYTTARKGQHAHRGGYRSRNEKNAQRHG